MAYGSPYSYEELKEKLLSFVKSNVKPSRFEHTLQVVKKAMEYAEKYGADKQKLEIAAIFHDAYRDAGNLEHGPLAAEHLEKDFGVEGTGVAAQISKLLVDLTNKNLKADDGLEKFIQSLDKAEVAKKLEYIADNFNGAAPNAEAQKVRE